MAVHYMIFCEWSVEREAYWFVYYVWRMWHEEQAALKVFQSIFMNGNGSLGI